MSEAFVAMVATIPSRISWQLLFEITWAMGVGRSSAQGQDRSPLADRESNEDTVGRETWDAEGRVFIFVVKKEKHDIFVVFR
jgi:hypothetical protein